MKPLIGITPEAITVGRTDGRGVFCGMLYAAAIECAGGIPVILPLTGDHGTLDEFLQRCDGFLLAGGGDLDESRGAYGRALTAAEKKTLSGVDTLRDGMELYLARQIVEQDLPVLGICRGIQVINVACGGTLLPDVPNHRHPQPDALAHRIQWTPTGRLPQLLGAGCDRVNTTHHQALDCVAGALSVVARAEDGIVEAVELPSASFCVGVQFHPERLLEVAPPFRRLFEALVAAAAAR
jgi:putative glutamine amidotransferase